MTPQPLPLSQGLPLASNAALAPVTASAHGSLRWPPLPRFPPWKSSRSPVA